MSVDEVTLGATVLPLIDQMTTASPHSLAVSGPDGTLTYGELSVRADRLARRLRQTGVKPGDLVGLCLDRSATLVAAALAIFKTEAAYVAIDPKYPDERIRWMLDDAGVAAVVRGADATHEMGPDDDQSGVVVVAEGPMRNGSVRDDSDPLRRPPLPTDLAYVVYTSGSTGRPKGVMVEHASLVNLVNWHRATFSLEATDRCTQIASPGFDAAVWEIWPTLASGSSLHVVPEDLRGDPIGLRDWLVAERITVAFVPTAVAEGIMGLAWPEDCCLRYLLTGGDALTRRPPPGLGFTVVNNYGLSETTVVATSGAVAPDIEGLPSIGRPIVGVEAEIVGPDLLPVEPGVAGELVIGGTAVSRGYLNRPELTAERFFDDPHGRRYRTGDRARLRSDGELEFLGRLDDQLSIRGFRVEPGEVETALNTHPAIRRSAVVGVGSSSAGRQLVAYLVASGSDQPHPDDLDKFLGAFLPEYLVPSTYVWLGDLPLTPHGKIDRLALPAAFETACDEVAEKRPEGRVEDAITSVVSELLDIPEIGMNQNFFLLGGHSMLGAQLIVRLEDLFGVEVTLRYLFEHPTLAEVATEVARQMVAGPADGL